MEKGENMEKYITKNEQDTINFAEQFAKNLKTGNIVLLIGELRVWQNKICSGCIKTFWFRK